MSSQQSMSVDDSDTEIENEPLDNVETMTMEKKEKNNHKISRSEAKGAFIFDVSELIPSSEQKKLKKTER